MKPTQGAIFQPDDTTSDVLSFEDKANILEKYFMTYLNPIFRKGYSNELAHDDLGPVSLQDKCELLYKDFERLWSCEMKRERKRRSLWGALWKTCGYLRVAYGIGLYALYAALSFGPILILNQLTQYLQGQFCSHMY